MSKPFATLLVYSSLIVLAAAVGGLIPVIAAWRRLFNQLFICFGAGILLGTAFLHILPEAVHLLGGEIGLPLMLGFLFLYVFEKFIMVHSCEGDCSYHAIGWSAFLGLSIHSLTAGMALGAGIVAPGVGFFMFLAILIHKLPESLSLSSILLHAAFSKKRTLLIILLFSLTIPAGAALTILLAPKLPATAVGWLIAFSAGTFLHIAADDLLPAVHSNEENRPSTLMAFLTGLAFMWFSKSILFWMEK